MLCPTGASGWTSEVDDRPANLVLRGSSRAAGGVKWVVRSGRGAGSGTGFLLQNQPFDGRSPPPGGGWAQEEQALRREAGE